MRWLNSTYDKVGNLRTQEIRQGANTITITYTWDAWNRLVKVEYGSSERARYQYNGLNWRTVKRSDTSSPPNGTLNQQRVMYYNAGWQLMEELINDSWTTSSSNGDHSRRMQYVWGLRYIDDIAVRRELEPIGTLGPGTTVTTWYHLTDTLFSTVAILDDSAQLVERVSYDAYGRARHHRMADLTGDGSVDQSDRDAMRGINWGDYGVGDLNRDGIVDNDDLALLNADWGRGLGEGRISSGGTDNIVGYAGYIFNAEMHGAGLYTIRYRNYSPELGRWIGRDQAGYVDGMALYEYVRGRVVSWTDPSGLIGNPPWNPSGRDWPRPKIDGPYPKPQGCSVGRLASRASLGIPIGIGICKFIDNLCDDDPNKFKTYVHGPESCPSGQQRYLQSYTLIISYTQQDTIITLLGVRTIVQRQTIVHKAEEHYRYACCDEDATVVEAGETHRETETKTSCEYGNFLRKTVIHMTHYSLFSQKRWKCQKEDEDDECTAD